jgi:hypothetical protein
MAAQAVQDILKSDSPDLPSNRHVMLVAPGDVSKAGQETGMIQKQMQGYSSFGGAELSLISEKSILDRTD